MTRTAILMLLTALLFVSGTKTAIGQSPAKKSPRSAPPATRDKAAPAYPALIDQDGYRQFLEEQRGKPLLVNFWATWCEPCRGEFPMINELARTYAPRGLVVMAVSLDEDSEISQVRQFLAQTKPRIPIFRKKPGKDEDFINAVHSKWSGALPATFFYDREGRLAANLVGEHKRREFERIIQRLLNTARSGTPAAASNPAP